LPHDNGGSPVTGHVVQAKVVDEWKELSCETWLENGNVFAETNDLLTGITYWYVTVLTRSVARF